MHGLLDKTAALAQVSALEKEYGVRVGFSDADVTDPAAVATMIQAARADFGSLDILCNNAGIQHVSPVVDFPHDKVWGQKGGGGNKGGSRRFVIRWVYGPTTPFPPPPPPPLSVEGRHRRLPERPLLRHPGRDSGDAGAGVGPHHQHGEHARTGGVPVQERVQRG
jgi:hypothetical protein